MKSLKTIFSFAVGVPLWIIASPLIVAAFLLAALCEKIFPIFDDLDKEEW